MGYRSHSLHRQDINHTSLRRQQTLQRAVPISSNGITAAVNRIGSALVADRSWADKLLVFSASILPFTVNLTNTAFLSTGDDLVSETQTNMRFLSWAQGQADLFELTLQRVLQAMQGADQAAQRAKALRSLGQMLAEDADLFSRVSTILLLIS